GERVISSATVSRSCSAHTHTNTHTILHVLKTKYIILHSKHSTLIQTNTHTHTHTHTQTHHSHNEARLTFQTFPDDMHTPLFSDPVLFKRFGWAGLLFLVPVN